MSQGQNIEVSCNPATGLCAISDSLFSVDQTIDWNADEEIIYIGDPMCSWCWGISPQLNALKRYGHQESIPFTIVMGGLRPGGGDVWNQDFKNFLKHHWEEVNKRSGQPFGHGLFDLENFDYDTEPACRAVVTIRTIAPKKVLRFYELIQHTFYVQSKDPKKAEFYKPICENLDIDFNTFSHHFSSQEMIDATQQDFMKSRQIGVSSFPSVLYRKKNQLHLISSGYSTYTEMKKVLDEAKSN